MAAHWSNENVSVDYFRESQATAMAVDSTGEFALLAGRRGLDLINLDNPGVHYPRVKRKGMMKWDISVVEWNPHYGRHKEFVTASNQVADLYAKREGDWFQEHSLKAHTRAISDLNWSVYEPDLLATCSVDTYIYLWDTREPKKPSLAFSTFAGAAQVKWNKRNINYLATVHEGDIRLWDKRKNSQAVQYISASLSKIHGLDWDPGSENFLVTASQDCTAKFWDVRDPKKTILELRTNTPLWRARYTPFGDGLVTATVPQLRRGEKSLLLWSQSNPVGAIHSFTGHTDDVLDFQWRTHKEGSNDFQLITWSRDHSLRIWRVEPHLQKLCGVDIPEPVSPQDPLISSFELVGTPKDPQMPLNGIGSSGGTPASTPGALNEPLVANGSGGVIGSPETTTSVGLLASGSYSQKPSLLEQEFASVKINLPNVTIQKMDVEGQFCTITAFSHRHILIMKIFFPPSYPEKATPKLVFLPATTLDSTVKHKLLKILEDTCIRQMENNKLCLEACLQQLSVSIDGMKLTSEIPSEPPTPPASSSYKQTSSLPSTYGSYLDNHIPFPRTSGARFSGVDKLVVFLRPGTIKKSGSHHTTPRALSSLSTLNLLKPLPIGPGPSSQSPEVLPSLLRNFYKEREKKQRRIGKHRKKTFGSDPSLPSKSSTTTGSATASSLVVLYSAVGLTPVHQELAKKYQFIRHNIPLMCTLNAEAAASVGRTDLVQVWSLAALSNSSELQPDSDADGETPWAQHPFGRQLLQTLFDHYSSLHDVQTLAMLSCAFGSISIQPSLPAGGSSQSQDVKSYLVTDSSDPIFTKEWSNEKSTQGMSFSESPDDYRFGENRDPEQIEKEQHRLSTRLLEPCLTAQFDAFKRSYADILYRWRLLNERAQVLNYVSCPSHTKIDLSFSDFGVICQKCNKRSYKVQCEHCRSYSFQCAICHTAVKGSSSFCLACGHGGHTSHMLQWFKTEDVCPTGCGCQCQANTKLVCEKSPLSTDPVVTR
ncbi:GATOR complex protein WDR59-like [Patiria miniata]|uniref:WDR59/RTC1-like RING zinc finger domain-containing protein n=1 Tax=Patiria miniata TaxID=46514 RepID=A0A914AXU6_PATMI|nr:GATOR complex protein WDR59-like [Patiria miniata]